MKKLLVSAVILLMGTVAYAQKGSVYIGGEVGFETIDGGEDGEDGSAWVFGPEIGTWLSDQNQLGIVLRFQGDDFATTIAPHLYFRRWFPLNEKFSLYAGVNARFVSISPDEGESDSNFDFFLDAGASYSFCLLYTSPSPRDRTRSRMPSSA